MSATLLNSKTPAILKSEIILKSSGFDGLFLAVEGDFDSRFWGARIDPLNARIVHCGGKPNLLGLLDLYANQNYNRLTAVTDADFDHILGHSRSLWCLSYTDLCDLECTLINSHALTRILAEYCDTAKIAIFENQCGYKVKEYLRVVCTCFGQLRLINAVNNYMVDFNQLSPYKYIDIISWQLDESALIRDFINLAGISSSQLTIDQNQVLTQSLCASWSLVQGHDCMRILAIGLSQNVIGLAKQKSIDQTELQKAFRLTFDHENLTQTKMFQDLVQAEKRHGLKLFV